MGGVGHSGKLFGLAALYKPGAAPRLKRPYRGRADCRTKPANTLRSVRPVPDRAKTRLLSARMREILHVRDVFCAHGKLRKSKPGKRQRNNEEYISMEKNSDHIFHQQRQQQFFDYNQINCPIALNIS
jgi:hypothetical protein